MTGARALETGFAAVEETELYYEVAGTGHPLVLIHGGLVDSRMWDEQFGLFARHYRVVRYDARGFGRSPLPATPYSNVRDLRGLLHALRIERAHVLGLSLGGAIAIEFASAHADMVGALVLVAASLRGYALPDDERTVEQFGRFTAAVASDDHPRAIEAILGLWVDGTIAPAARAVRQRMRDLLAGYSFAHFAASAPREDLPAQPSLDRLAAIRAPTLVVVGDQDRGSLQTIATLLTREIHGARQVVIPGAGHMVNLDRPEAFADAALDFLAGL